MDRCEDVFTPREGDLSESSSPADQKVVDSQPCLHVDEINPHCDSNNDSAPFAKINATPVTAESALIAEAKQMRLDRFHSDKLCTSAASTSISSSFPITAEYARMILGHSFKVSRCRTIQALKLGARVKCTRYNAAAILDETLIHD